MYNAFKFRKDKAETERLNATPKPLRETNPVKAARKMNRLSENARARRDAWISKIDFDNDQTKSKFFSDLIPYLVLDNGGNDSLTFKV